MRLNYYNPPENAAQLDGCPTEEHGGYSVTAVKQFLKKFGGAGYTLHIDRDGGVFETSAIELTGNNSKFKYNRHL
jgi:hypothetical protein